MSDQNPVGTVGKGTTEVVTTQPAQAARVLTQADLDALKAALGDAMFGRFESYFDKRLPRADQPATAGMPSTGQPVQMTQGNPPQPPLGRGAGTTEVVTTQAAPATTQTVDAGALDAWAARMQKMAGVELMDDDPEARLIDRSSPERFQATLVDAIEARKLRGTPPSRTPTNLGMTGSANKPDLQAQYEADLKKVRRGDVSALANLKAEYRRKGLGVW